VRAFIEKPPRGEAPSNLVNAGTYVLETSVLARIPDGRPVSIERETFPALVADGALFALPTHDYWLDAGRPALYLQANLDLLDGVRAGGAIAGVADGVEVAPDAVVEHAVIGPGGTVEAGALVRDSVLLPGVRVGAGATVERSVVGRGVEIGPGARLDGAVVGDGERLPAGAVLTGVSVPAPG
jgi:mannose-1-phosphate guanylyltransferase